MHSPQKRVPAADGSANPTSQGRFEHSSTGQAPATKSGRRNVATRFGDALALLTVLAMVTLAHAALTVEGAVYDIIDAIEEAYGQ